MILSFHGRRTSVSECRQRCGPGRNGLTAETLARAAREYGLEVNAYSVEPEALGAIQLPAIAHWEFKHFVVVEKWFPRSVSIVDPSRGRRTVSAAEFSDSFTGVILTFEPGGLLLSPARKRVRPPWLRYVSAMLEAQGAWSTLSQILVASLILQGVGLMLPLMTKVVVDRVLPSRLSSAMTVLGLGILLVIVAQALTSCMRSLLLINLRARLDSKLTLKFFEHLLSLPFRFFQDKASGDLLMRLGSNTVVREMLTAQALSMILDGSFVLVYLAILLTVARDYGVLVMIMAALQLSIMLVTRARIRSLSQRDLAAKASEQSYLVEAIKGIATLKASGTESRAYDRWSNLFFEQLNVSMDRSRLSAVIDAGLGAIRGACPLLLMWFGVLQVLDGRMALGTMLAVNSLAASFLAPITTLVSNVQQLEMAAANLERIVDVLDTSPEQRSGEGRLARRIEGTIEVRNLSFQYDTNGPPVLENVSFTVEPGQKVALVGPTGSGKSTLAMLLLGLYEPTDGEILYDGTPLKQLDYGTLRSQVGVVLQEPFLFSGSIRQNIAFINPDMSLQNVMEAAMTAGVHEDISRMPMAYEAFVSEAGSTLSGGQRQRIAIARALARKPSIMILDEATSHLDVRTEAEVDRNLSELSCTRIVIAHRLSTVRNASRILVLDRGRLVEEGTHDQLAAMGGPYTALVHGQLRDAAAERERANQVSAMLS